MRRLVKRDEKIWENNPIAQVILYLPASIISGLLSIPMILLALPGTLFGKSIERKWTKLLLILQHTASLSFWYFVGNYIYPSLINLTDIQEALLILLLTYFNFKNTINTLCNETLTKTYADN